VFTQLNRIIFYITLVIIIAIGLWLRWQFIHTVQLYPDEFVTLLAVRMIGEKGLPIMPSGLFYDHGLLFSYLASLAAMLGPARLAARYASLLFGGLALLLTFWLGRRWFSPAIGLIAVTGLAIAPTAIHWSGRARMYALLQLLVLLTIWLVYAGISKRKAYLRRLALFAYLGALLTHFAAVTLAPPLVVALLVISWQSKAREQKNTGTIPSAPLLPRSPALPLWANKWQLILEIFALIVTLLIAFLVKRVGQPKGIEALDGSAGQAVTGLAQVFTIYSDFSFNLVAGWQAIAPFYLTLPALIFTPFALVAIIASFVAFVKNNSQLPTPNSQLFLSLILSLTTLEMILLVSPDRRDDKYQFMLLPILLLLGAQGMAICGSRLLSIINYQLPIIILSALLLILTWPGAQALLANTGDDYDAAFAYVQQHWQEGDTILTGTPAAAAFYLGRNDFYSVQRRGGYNYRILTINNRPVDRWLASPAIRTESDLHQTLANNNVWLVLERWGLQREYYNLSFQQQLLAQTDLVAETQGIFVLRSKANPQPINPTPAEPAEAEFANLVRLTGYTLEPESISPGATPRITLYWQALAPMPEDYTVFVHLRDSHGDNVAQADHRPLGSLYPTSLWPVGEIIRESSDLPLSPGLPPGEYNLWAGLYLLETGERLPVKNDSSGENAVKLGGLRLGDRNVDTTGLK
jgi:uncharacterized membrane protein